MSKNEIKKKSRKKSKLIRANFQNSWLVHETGYLIKGKPEKIKKQNSQSSKIKNQNK